MESEPRERQITTPEAQHDPKHRLKLLGGLAAYASDTMPTAEREELGQAFYRELMLPPDPEGSVNPVVTMAITGPAMLSIREVPVRLHDHQIFLWNLLMHLRSREAGVTRSDAFAFNLAPDKTETNRSQLWNRNMGYLMERVNEAAGVEAIQMEGAMKHRRYSVHPAVSIIDQREGAEYSGLYHFARTIMRSIIHHPALFTRDIRGTEPAEIIVRDDETVVIDNKTVFLNPHELSLLNILTLRGSKPLPYATLFGLGFHVYAPSETAKLAALWRSLHSLNELVGSDDPLIRFFPGYPAAIGLARGLRIIDLRNTSALPTRKDMLPAFTALLGQAERYLQSETRHMEPGRISQLLRAHGGSMLTMRERYTLSLRYGLIIADLLGTSYTPRDGVERSYNQLIGHITPNEIISHRAVGEILNLNNGNVFTAEQKALQKIEELPLLDALRQGRATEKAIHFAEQLPIQDRLQAYRTGRVQAALAERLACPLPARRAVAFYLSQPHARTALTPQLQAGLYYVRIALRKMQRDTDAGEILALLPGLRNYYQRAFSYMVKITGTGQTATTFSELTSHNTHFAEAGEQHIADACAVLAAFLSIGSEIDAG